MPSVMSVQGPLTREALGLTLPHEHLFVDLRCYCPAESTDVLQRELFRKPVSHISRDLVANHPWDFRDNPVLDDPDSAGEEARSFANLDGKTIVDMSCSRGMGRNPQGLRAVAEQTGVNVIMSSGRYTLPALTDQERRMSVADIADSVYDEFVNGVEGGIRPGMLKAGFVDTIDKAPEIRSLQAVGRIQSKVGCALAVHPYIWHPDSHIILDILEEEGCDLRRVILCHQDFLGKRTDYLNSLCKRGAYIEFDTFGSGWINDRMWQQADDVKIGYLRKQIEMGNQEHLLISGDMCLKFMFSKWGGLGLINIPKLVIPAMRTLGFSEGMIHMITVENPARILCH